MVKKKTGTRRRRTSTRPAAPATASGSGLLVRVDRQDHDVVRAAVDWSKFPKPSATFAADAARAVNRYGNPELQFAQCHRLNDTLTRVLAIRYTPEQFRCRADENDAFRSGLESWLLKVGQKAVGHASKALFEGCISQGGEGVACATIDADMELMIRSGNRAAIVFAGMEAWNRHEVLAGKVDDLWLHPLVEVTMPSAVLCDLLADWKACATQG